MSIEVSNLLKTYGDQHAVNAISFKVEKGEIVGFLGPNGAGKSTLLKIITGYLQQTAGEAFVCGINVAESPIESKRKIGYLPELNALYYDMYVREYLGFIAAVHEVKEPAKRMEEVISLTGLTVESKKKSAIIQDTSACRFAALIHDPEVLILDEPTTGLDPNQIIEIREVIRQQGQHKTVLFSSHILQEVEAICDRVIIIHKGNIVANDKLAVLRQSGSNQESVQVEFKEAVSISRLQELKGVVSVSAQHHSLFNILCTDAESLKKQLLQLSIDQNLNIVSLQSQKQSLESIFKALTN
jgi:ABC-2 type transport system ATP-binding protein